MRHILTISASLTLALTLSACDRKKQEPEPQPEVTASTEPAQSIIRPDYQEPEMQIALPTLEARIGFEDEGYELNEAAEEELASIIASEQVAGGWPIVLRAHSDSSGNDRGNLAASEKRGDAVRSWLIENGVDEERITLIPFGEQNPAEPNALPDGTPNEAGRAANRRVNITIADPDAAASDDDSETGETEENPATDSLGQDGEQDANS